MFKFAAASLFAFVALVAAQADPSINTPASLVQCQPAQLSWTATKEPVFISIIPGGQPGAAPLHDFGQQAPGTKSLTWKVDLPAGTSVTAQIRDSTGAVAYSANVNIQSSPDASCVKPNQPPPPGASSAAPSAPGGSSAPAATSRSAAATTPAASATRPVASNGTSRAPATATTAGGSTAAASNAALPGAQIGWTGLMGVLAAFIAA